MDKARPGLPAGVDAAPPRATSNGSATMRPRSWKNCSRCPAASFVPQQRWQGPPRKDHHRGQPQITADVICPEMKVPKSDRRGKVRRLQHDPTAVVIETRTL